MDRLLQFRMRLRSLFRKERLYAAMEEELRIHIEMETEANIASGMTREEARQAALEKFGRVESYEEKCRYERRVKWIENPIQDLCSAFQMLGKTPGFTIVSVLTLTLGIGVNLALFALLNDQLLRPRPVVSPGELWAICPADASGNPCNANFGRPYYEAVRKNKGVFNGIVGYARIFPKLRTQDGWEMVVAELVSGDYFKFLGVQPMMGRGFLPEEDDQPGAHKVVVISHRFWQHHFHADRHILGRTLILNDQVLEVIGVAPRSFSSFDGPLCDFWMPTSLENQMDELSSYTLLGRLRNGVGPVEASESLTPTVREVTRSISAGAIADREQYGYSPSLTGVMLVPVGYGSLAPEIDRGLVARQIGLGALATLLVLFIAATNLASLLLARGLGRRKELATRLALGATRGVLMRRLMFEGVLVATLGSVCGVLLLRWLGHSLPALILVVVNRATPLLPDFRVVAVAVAGALLVGAGFSVVPALEATRFHPLAALKDPEGVVGLPRGRWSWKKALIVVQVAGSLVLFSGTCLCVCAINRQLQLDVGFRTDRLTMAMLDLEKIGYTTKTAPPMVEELRRRLALLPGVEAVGMTETRPFSFQRGRMRVPRLDGYEPPEGTGAVFDFGSVGPDSFRALGIPVLLGRDVSGADLLFHRPVALVNESFLKRYWPGQNPLGKQIDQFEIVGVVGDARLLGSPLERPTPAVYFAGHPESAQRPTLIICSTNKPDSLVSAIRAELVKVHPQLGESHILTMGQAMRNILVVQRSALNVLGVLAGVALGLTVLGVFGVASHLVAQRRREMAIRLAIGARRSDVAKLILRFGLGLAGAGVGFGLPAAIAGALVLRHAVYGVKLFDVTAYVTASVVVLVAVVLVCWFPARRASAIDPMTVLRFE